MPAVFRLLRLHTCALRLSNLSARYVSALKGCPLVFQGSVNSDCLLSFIPCSSRFSRALRLKWVVRSYGMLLTVLRVLSSSEVNGHGPALVSHIVKASFLYRRVGLCTGLNSEGTTPHPLRESHWRRYNRSVLAARRRTVNPTRCAVDFPVRLTVGAE